MCLVQKGKVIELNGNIAIVLVNTNKREVRIEGEIKIGDEINVFQNLGFKK
jgi:hydrogenase maturation factor